MDYTNLPLWVIRIIRQVFTALRKQGVYFYHVDNAVLEPDREEDLIWVVRLRNKVKISCILPTGITAKVTIHHHRNRPAFVEIEGLALELNRYIKTKRIVR